MRILQMRFSCRLHLDLTENRMKLDFTFFFLIKRCSREKLSEQNRQKNDSYFIQKCVAKYVTRSTVQTQFRCRTHTE